MEKIKNNIYLKLFISFFKAGLFTIGGGLAMLPVIQKFVVDDEGWLTEEEMIDGIAVAQSLPGVVAINIATYIGKKKAGIAGALVSTFGTILPSYIIIILISMFLGAVGDNVFVEGALTGIKAAAAGLICVAGIKLGKSILKGPLTWVIAIASFAAIVCFGLKAVYVILGSALIGIILNCFREVKS